MKVLFFLEPAIEMGNPLFRYATLRNSILPQYKSLISSGHDVTILVSDNLAEQAFNDGHSRKIEQLAVIDSVQWVDGENSLTRSLRHQAKQFHAGEIERLKGMLSDALGADYSPDVVIVWESPTYYLEEIFPQATILYQMPGFFSRPPFVSMVSISQGLLDKEPVRTCERQLTDEEEQSLATLRDKERQFLKTTSPASSAFQSMYRDFDRVVLFPLQIDGYFMIDSVLGGEKTQFDILTALLETVPPNIGLLVTNYKSRDAASGVLTPAIVTWLRSRYSNFLYFEHLDAAPWVSQFLVPEVDGVISISSSVGFQAAYWKKPLFSFGKTHLSVFNTAKNQQQFFDQVNARSSVSRDDLIFQLMETQHVTAEFMESPNYAQWLEAFHQSKKFKKWNDTSIVDILDRGRRESNLLSELNFSKKISEVSSSAHCKELSQEIKKHEIISFDIFDTLLYRPFRHPADLFDYMNEAVGEITGNHAINFREARQAAEKAAFAAAIGNGRGEISITEIYEALSREQEIDPDTAEQIKALETQLEFELLYPRPSGFSAYQEALAAGKTVVLVSDMYLPEEFLHSVLVKNGFSSYHKLYVSSAYGVKKHSGALFDVVINDLGVAPSTVLHVGDNFVADVQKAKDKGLRAFHLPKASEHFKETDAFLIPWARDVERQDLSSSMLLAIAGNALASNPYIPQRKGTLFGGDPMKLGFYGFGPLLLGYAKFVIEAAIRDGVDRLYFLARDGKIIKEAYNLLAKEYPEAPESHYLLCSRRSVNVAKLESLADIMDLLHVDFAHRTKLGNLFTHRFGVNSTDIDQKVLEKYGLSWSTGLTKADLPRLRKVFTELAPAILEAAGEERANYLAYLSESGIFSEGKVAVVDIGYAGTMQESLFKLSGSKKKISGYYLMTFRAALKRLVQNGLDVRAYLADFVDRHDTYHPFCRFVPLYETLFSSSDGSFLRMAKHWSGGTRPVYMERSPLEQTRERLVRNVHSGALEFVELCVSAVNRHIRSIDVEPNKSIRVLNRYFESPHPRDAKILSGIVFEDAYGGAGLKTILPSTDNLSADCVWQVGREVLVRDAAHANSGKVVQEAKKGSAAESAVRVEQKSAVPPVGADNSANDAASEGRSSFSSKIIHWYLLRTLNERKRNKLIRNPELFFFDAKNPFTRNVIGAIYLKGRGGGRIS